MRTREELAEAIRDHGEREEWHQRRERDPQSGSDSHGYMYAHHKRERLRLEAELRRRFLS